MNSPAFQHMPSIIIKETNHDKVLQSQDKSKRHAKNMRKINTHNPSTAAWFQNIKRRSLEHPEGKPFPKYGKYRKKYAWDGNGLSLIAGDE